MDSGPTFPACATPLWTFNDPAAGVAGWAFNPYTTSADPYVDADGIDPANLSAQSTITWDKNGGTDPQPPLGEMTITIPFSAYTPPYGQKADFYMASLPAAAIDLSNSVITMMVKLDPAPDGGVAFSPNQSAPGGIVMYVKAGPKFVYAQNTYTNVVSSDHNWRLYTFDVKNGIDKASSPNVAAGFDPTAIVQLGFTINTGSGGPAQADGAPPSTAPPTPATFHIDSICLIPAQ